MTSTALMGAASLLLMLSGSTRTAPCYRNLRRLQGWTIAKVGAVRGEFKGCEYNRVITLDDGTSLTCASYGYQYAYSPDAIVFVKSIAAGTATGTLVKLMVEGDLYDMSAVVRK